MTEDLLAKVRFISRFYADDGQIEAEEVRGGDEVATLIRRIENSDAAFQRLISRAKVAAIGEEGRVKESAERGPASSPAGATPLSPSPW